MRLPRQSELDDLLRSLDDPHRHDGGFQGVGRARKEFDPGQFPGQLDQHDPALACLVARGAQFPALGVLDRAAQTELLPLADLDTDRGLVAPAEPLQDFRGKADRHIVLAERDAELVALPARTHCRQSSKWHRLCPPDPFIAYFVAARQN